ncbi:MAG TPA: hypothetical protein ENJ28_06795 [Gammaproteobacteria bacterium]|nr:hypothetical protein [Gammaproteobacteria bacterium]
MKFKQVSIYTLLLAILFVTSVNAESFYGIQGDGLTIGGTSDLLFTSETTGYASASGTFSALVATITAFDPQSDGTIFLASEHNFKTDDNGYFNTVDKSILYPVTDRPGVYMISTVFNIKEAEGNLSGYSKQAFNGTGIINFNNNTANVRYEGHLVKKGRLFNRQSKSMFKYFR